MQISSHFETSLLPQQQQLRTFSLQFLILKMLFYTRHWFHSSNKISMYENLGLKHVFSTFKKLYGATLNSLFLKGVQGFQTTNQPMELWKHLGRLESTKKCRVCSLLSRVLKLSFHFYCALPTSPCIHLFNHKSFLNYRKLRQIISYFIKYCISLSSAGSWESSSFNVT